MQPRLKQQGKSFDWNLEDLEKKGILKIIELAGYRALEIKDRIKHKHGCY